MSESENDFEVFLGTFNAQPWITGIIESLEEQTCKPFQVNIIDNNSTDKTVSLITDFLQENQVKNTYRLIKSNLNIGPMSTYLDRLDLFKKDWIFMVHQDDVYHPNHFQTLIDEVKNAQPSVSVLFTAMKRVDQKNSEIFSTPTLSSKVSETSRLDNFLLTLQINPVNYPSCALRKSALSGIKTTKHTTAFNDTEMLLRMMCISDLKYIPIETMHYRIHTGNASAITNSNSNTYATFIGFIELFHSEEFENLFTNEIKYSNSTCFFESVENALQIRIDDLSLRNLLRMILAERFIRLFGYRDNSASRFLIDAHQELNLVNEVQIINNLHLDSDYETLLLVESNSSKTNKGAEVPKIIKAPKSIFVKVFNNLPLNKREKIFGIIANSFFSRFIKRPFLKVWRNSNLVK